MTSQAAKTLVSIAPGDSEGRVEATLMLACGCTVKRSIAADRIVETTDGERIAVGKYPCPKGHPVRRPGG